MSSIFEALFLFLFVVLCLLSSRDEMDVTFQLLADDAVAAEDDKTCFLNTGVDISGRLYL